MQAQQEALTSKMTPEFRDARAAFAARMGVDPILLAQDFEPTWPYYSTAELKSATSKTAVVLVHLGKGAQAIDRTVDLTWAGNEWLIASIKGDLPQQINPTAVQDGGACRIARKIPQRQVWRGPCRGGYAHGEGILTVYSSHDDRLLQVAKTSMTEGIPTNLEEVNEAGDNQILSRPGQPDLRIPEDIALPPWASAFAQRGKTT